MQQPKKPVVVTVDRASLKAAATSLRLFAEFLYEATRAYECFDDGDIEEGMRVLGNALELVSEDLTEMRNEQG